MFERFAEESRGVVVRAGEEARALGHEHIGTEHLLLGLVVEETGLGGRILREAGLTADSVRGAIGPPAAPGEGVRVHLPFHPHAKRALEDALRWAIRLTSHSIGTEHILLGVLEEQEGRGSRLVVGSVPVHRVVAAVLKEVPASVPADPRWARGRAASALRLGFAVEPSAPGSEVEAAEARVEPLTESGHALPARLAAIEQRLAATEARLAELERGSDEAPAAGTAN